MKSLSRRSVERKPRVGGALMMVAAICFIVAVAVNAQNGAPPAGQTSRSAAAKQATPAAAPSAQTVSANQAVVQKYCASCHNEQDEVRRARDHRLGSGERSQEHGVVGTRHPEGSHGSHAAGRASATRKSSRRGFRHLSRDGARQGRSRKSEPGTSVTSTPQPLGISQRDSRLAGD